MKKHFQFFIALFVSTLVMGQTSPDKNTIVWSPPLSNKKNTTYNQFVGENEDGVFVTKTTVKEEIRGNYAFPTLEMYDQSFNLIRSQNLDVKEGRGRILYENTVLIEGNLYLLYSLVYVWNQSITLMIQPLDTNTLEAIGEPKKVMETKIPTIVTRGHLTDFQFDFSDDNSSLLVTSIEPVGGNKNQTVHLYVLNSHIDKGWSKTITLPYQAKMFDMVSRSIDNHGNVYLLGAKYLEGNRDKKNGRPNYNYVLMGYSHDGNPSFSHNIISKDKFFRDMRIAVTPRSEIICTGFYSHDGEGFTLKGLGSRSNIASSYSVDRPNQVGGVYYLKLDMDTKAILTESYQDFTLEFLTQNMENKEAKKAVRKAQRGKTSEAFSFNLDDLVMREDGSVTMIGEQTSNTTARIVKPAQPNSHTGATYMAQTSTTEYYSYLDIIAVHLTPEGELEWAEKIAKRQNTVGDFGLFSSYTMAFENDRLHFAFNDNPQNLYYNGRGTLANFNPRKAKKNVALAIVTMDAQGNKSKRYLAQPSGSIVLLKPGTSRQFSPNNLFLFGQYKTDFRLAKLVF